MANDDSMELVEDQQQPQQVDKDAYMRSAMNTIATMAKRDQEEALETLRSTSKEDFAALLAAKNSTQRNTLPVAYILDILSIIISNGQHDFNSFTNEGGIFHPESGITPLLTTLAQFNAANMSRQTYLRLAQYFNPVLYPELVPELMERRGPIVFALFSFADAAFTLIKILQDD